MASLSFLDLPGEIRNKIYTLLLVLPAIYTPRPLGSDGQIYPSILSVCQKIHHEALPFLYGHNTFIAHATRLTSLPSLRYYYDFISLPQTISRIKKYYLIVRLDCDARFDKEQATKAFDGTEELTVQVYQNEFKGCGYDRLRALEGVRGVKRVEIKGSVTSWPEYVGWLKGVMMLPVGTEVGEFVKEEKRKDLEMWNDFGR